MIVTAAIAILSSIAFTGFVNYQNRAKASEVMVALSKITQGEVAYYQKNQEFLEAGPTNIPPSSNRVAADFSLDPRWRMLSFEFADAVYFGYQAVIASATEVSCQGVGDLDGDGNTSLFQRTVLGASAGNAEIIGGVFMFDELE